MPLSPGRGAGVRPQNFSFYPYGNFLIPSSHTQGAQFKPNSSSLNFTVMSPEAIQRSALLDILFEHRNKSYGAYELRTAYSRRLAKGIAIAMLIPFLLYAAIRFQPDKEQSLPLIDNNDGIILTIIDPPPPPEPRGVRMLLLRRAVRRAVERAMATAG